MKQRDSDVSQLLPWHVNRTLDEKQSARLDAALEDDPDLASEHLWLQSLRRTLREDTPARSDDTGLDELLARVRAERTNTLKPFPSAAPAPRRPAWLPRGYALAASVILAQAALIGVLVMERDEYALLSFLAPLASKQTATPGVVLQVVFREQASEAAIRAALRDARGEIVGGPGALGVYRIKIAAPGADAALARLRGNGEVVENAVKEGGR